MIPALAYFVDKPVAGYYTFSLVSKETLTSEHLQMLRENPYPGKLMSSVVVLTIEDASLMLVADDGIKISSHLESYLIKAGGKVGIVSTVLDDGIPFKQTVSASC